MSEHTVYRAYIGKVPLYVGCSSNVSARLRKHRDRRPEFNAVTKIVTTTHATRREALDVERAEILRLNPVLNRRQLKPEQRVVARGDLAPLLSATVEKLGTCTSTDVIAALPHVPANSVFVGLKRLREAGSLNVVGRTRPGGYVYTAEGSAA